MAKHIYDLLSIEQARKEFNVDRRTIYRWIAAGMPYRVIWKRRLFDFDDCVKWLAERPELRGGSRNIPQKIGAAKQY